MAEDFFRIRKGIVVANTSASANLDPISLKIGSSTVNSTGVYAATVNAGTITGITSLNITTVTATTFNVGALFTANSTLVNAAAINVTNQINAASMFLSGQANAATLNVTTSANVGANVQLTTTSLGIGNTSVNTFANSSLLRVTGAINANGSVGTANQALLSDGTKSYYGNVEMLGVSRTHNFQAGAYTLVLTDAGKTIYMGGAGNLFVPNTASVAWATDTYINIVQYGTSQTTVAGNTGVTIRAKNGTKTSGQYAMATLTFAGANEWILGGDCST